MAEKKEIVLKKSVVVQHLKSLLSVSDSIYGVVLSTLDGHAVSSLFEGDHEDSKLAAMTSSCLALGEKIAVEVKQKGCDFVIIQNQDGYVAIKKIGTRLVVTALAHTSINLGMLLSSTQNMASRLADEISV
ncbi:roadblock/LC7 domain-containing protein [Aurantivibrio plasticivorans]